MKVVVAGGSGFIGQATVRALHHAGHDVLVLSRSTPGFPPGVVHHSVDLTQPLLTEHREAGNDAHASINGWLSDADAVVNLVGIAIETPSVSFRAAHVDVARHLVDACQRFGIRRLVHVSVVRIEAANGAYHRTKREGEAVVQGTGSDLDWTILRPGLVYGPGDDMMSNLVGLIRAAPVFAVPAGVGGGLDVVDVEDVARAVERTLGNANTHGQCIDVVGPERLQLSALIGRVSSALALRTVCVPLPRALMRAAAGVMEAVLPRPPVTRTQLDMLIEGLYGAPQQADDALDLRPVALAPDRIREIAASLPASAGPPSVRIVSSANHREELERWRVPLAVMAVLVGLMAVLPWPSLSVLPTILPTILAINLAAAAVLIAKAQWVHRPATRALLPMRALAVGLLCAAVGVTLAQLMMLGVQRFAPGLLAQTAEVTAWAEGWHWAVGVPLLVVTVALEDLVWRFGVTFSLVRRFGPLGAASVGALLFALAHATVGPPILVLAAALAGFAWSLIALRTRSWIAVSTCHVVWDLAMLFLLSR